MTRREYKIPVYIHKPEKSDKTSVQKPKIKKEAKYIETEQTENTVQYLEKMKKRKKQEKPTEMTEEFADNIMAGMLKNQDETEKKQLTLKTKHDLILWLGVSIFVLIILIVWGMAMRGNFLDMSGELNKNNEKAAINSFSDKFSDSLNILNQGIKDFDEMKAEIRTQEAEQKIINDLKNKINQNSDTKSLPNQN